MAGGGTIHRGWVAQRGRGLWSAAGGVSRPHPQELALVLIRGLVVRASGRGSPGLPLRCYLLPVCTLNP